MAGAARAQGNMLTLSPKAATRPDETHAALALAPNAYTSPVRFSGRVATLAQLRTGSPPNSWECAWLVWNYADPDHFYYLALKPTGWELGKRDPAYPGGQRFLATGPRTFAIGSWHAFRIVQRDNAIKAFIDGEPLVDFTDKTPPFYKSGKLGLYTEDAAVAIDSVTHPVRQDFDGLPLESAAADESRLGGWSLPFLGFGSASIAPAPLRN